MIAVSDVPRVGAVIVAALAPRPVPGAPLITREVGAAHEQAAERPDDGDHLENIAAGRERPQEGVVFHAPQHTRQIRSLGGSHG